MKTSSFLHKLKKKDTIMLIEPSEDISKAYEVKSTNCIQVAQLAYDAQIYENAVSEAYYAMYHGVLSLFYKCGIKCENHTAAIKLIHEVFDLKQLHDTILRFKKERIDNQYYVVSSQDKVLQKQSCLHKIHIAKEFIMHVKTYAEHIKIQEINIIRTKFERL